VDDGTQVLPYAGHRNEVRIFVRIGALRMFFVTFLVVVLVCHDADPYNPFGFYCIPDLEQFAALLKGNALGACAVKLADDEVARMCAQ